MSSRSLLSDSKKDKHKTRGQLLDELSELRAKLADKTEDLAGRDLVIGMLDGITEPVLVLDDASKVVYGNSAAARLFAKDGEAIGGKSLWDLYPKGYSTLFYNAYEKARTGRSTGKFREQHRLLGKWFDVYLYPVPGGMTVLFNDITVSRQMEELPRLALTLLHNLKDNVFLLRADGRMFHVNNETQNSLGYSSDELHKMSIADVVPPSCANEWHDILDRIRQHGSMTFESRLRAQDGHEFPVEVYANYIELYSNSYYTISARNITERKQAEQARALLASIVHTAHEAIVSLTPEGVITSWNHGAEWLYGYKADDVIGSHVSMLAPPDRQTEIAEVLERMRSEGLPVHYETVRLRKDGTLIDISLTLSPIVDSSGAFLGSSAIVHDISERKRAEEALARSAKDFRSIVTRNADAMIILDLEGYVQYVNPRVESLYNLPASDFVGQLFGFPLLLDDPVEMYVLKEFKKFVAVETRMVEVEWQGKPSYLLSLQDITERKKAAEAIVTARDYYLKLFEDFPALIWRSGTNGKCNYFNKSWLEFTGRTLEQEIGDCRTGGIHPDDIDRVVKVYTAAFNARQPFVLEYRLRHKDGSYRSIVDNGKPFYGLKSEYSGFIGSCYDITERKQAEEALQETRDYLESLIDFANAPIIVWDPEFTITRFNHAFERLSGYTAAEVVGNDLSVLFPPSGKEESLDKIRRTLAGEYWVSAEIPILNKDGSIRIVLWNSANIYSEDKTRLLATIAQGQDITERKQAEEALQVAKAQAELYVDLMGHDINNMNMVAMWSLEIALMDIEQDGKLDIRSKPLLDKSLESLNNSSALISNVQKLQRASVEGINLQAVDVADVLKGIIDEQRSTPGKDVTIYYKNEATHCLVTANELLGDVFTNIISNAIKHARTDRHLTIGVTVEGVVEDGRKFCRVAIDDNGPGIPDEVKDQLFRRFSRGETKAKGSGLGLYLVKTLVEHYGGDIRVEDRVPGDHTKGARFVITIPSIE